MRHLDQRCARETPFSWYCLLRALPQRKALKNAPTSSPRSKTSTKAEPTTTPSTWPAKRAT